MSCAMLDERGPNYRSQAMLSETNPMLVSITRDFRMRHHRYRGAP